MKPERMNRWCKYNAYIAYLKVVHKCTLKPLSMDKDFIEDWARINMGIIRRK